MTRDRVVSALLRAFLRVFAIGAAASVLAVLVRTWHLASTVGIGRLRDFPVLFHVAGRAVGWAGLPRAERLGWLSWAHEPHALWSVGDAALFVASALALQLVLVGALSLLAAPVAAFCRGVVERHRATFIATLFVAFLAPGVAMSVDFRSGAGLHMVALALLGALLLVFVVRIAVARALRVRRLGSGAVAAAVVVAAVLLGLNALLAARDPEPSSAARRPNVLFISVDTLRADHIHSYGYPRQTTPNIDRIAAEGVRFAEVVSPSSWTLPTHVTMLTGLPPVEHGVNRPLGLRLDRGVTTLPERLRSEGYATAAFVAGGYVAAEYGHLQGFEVYDDYSVPLLCRRERASYRNCSTSDKLVALVEEHLDAWSRAERERPFFVFLHLWDVHNDYVPPAPYDVMFAPGEPLGFAVGDIMDQVIDADALTPEQRKRMIGLYDGEIRYTDEWIGKLLGSLEELSVLDETIVVVTADHGEELGERQHWGHHRALYDESVMVPLVMRFPAKIPAGTVVTQQARLADVVPTLLSLIGMDGGEWGGERAADADGAARDLTPLLTGEAADWESSPAFSELHGRLVSIRTPGWKLIRDEERGEAIELYDLAADPEERENLVASRPDVVRRLSGRIAEWRGRFGDDGGHSDPLDQGEEQLEQLRALGYIE